MSAADPANAPDERRQIARIFQSYGWRDADEVARRLKDSLAAAGYDVWIDREHLRADDKYFAPALEKAVTDCDVVVALLSPHSVRGMAGEDVRASVCYNEILLADQLNRPGFWPIRVQSLHGPPPFLIIKYRQVNWLDWDQPGAYDKGVREITAALRQILSGDKYFDPNIDPGGIFAPTLRARKDDFVGRDWLFARLDKWLTSPAPCFVLEGVTGSGKTAIVAELVRRNPGGRMLAYYFCGAVPVPLALPVFVGTIAHMLAKSVDGYAEQLWNGKLADWLTGMDPTTMLAQGVLEPLNGLRVEENCYVVVDGLDEAVGADAQVLSLPALLSDALERFPPWLKLLITTRPHARIQPLFHEAETCVIGAGNEGQRMDVRVYVTKRLAEPALMSVIGVDQRDQTTSLIEQRADGNFQYAHSVLDALATRELDPRQLDALPDVLEGFYHRRAARRFPNPADFRLARVVLEVMVAAREPLTPRQLSAMTGLQQDTELRPALDALSCFIWVRIMALRAGEAYRIAHKSISDWLVSPDARAFRIDSGPGLARIITHCLNWRSNRETYALKHLIAHLLENGQTAAALNAVAEGLFAERLRLVDEPRLEIEDSRDLTLALIAAREKDSILKLARTERIAQRDGVAAALQVDRARGSRLRQRGGRRAAGNPVMNDTTALLNARYIALRTAEAKGLTERLMEATRDRTPGACDGYWHLCCFCYWYRNRNEGWALLGNASLTKPFVFRGIPDRDLGYHSRRSVDAHFE